MVEKTEKAFDWRAVDRDCKIVKRGKDSRIGSYYSAPCGWGTYNSLDISHYKWHELGLNKHGPSN